MPTSRFRNETLLYNSDETELLSRVRVRPGSGIGACSSVESSLSGLLRKYKKKKREMLFANCCYHPLRAQMASSSDPEDLPSL